MTKAQQRALKELQRAIAAVNNAKTPREQDVARAQFQTALARANALRP